MSYFFQCFIASLLAQLLVMPLRIWLESRSTSDDEDYEDTD